MRRSALLLLAALALAGCTHPAPTAPAPATPTPPTIRSAARPAGWKAVGYQGISFLVPATWRVRDGRKLPCPAIGLGSPGPAVVLGHSNLRGTLPDDPAWSPPDVGR
jgi:hypothetical protein